MALLSVVVRRWSLVRPRKNLGVSTLQMRPARKSAQTRQYRRRPFWDGDCTHSQLPVSGN